MTILAERPFAPIPRAQPTESAARPAARSEPRAEGPSPFSQVLSRLGSEVRRGEAIVGHATSGQRDLAPGELLALQAGVYRYGEAVDLAAKLVERATSSVKTVVQGQ